MVKEDITNSWFFLWVFVFGFLRLGFGIWDFFFGFPSTKFPPDDAPEEQQNDSPEDAAGPGIGP